jgi:RNA polymerase sigma-70 factor (ECF subfamily)
VTVSTVQYPAAGFCQEDLIALIPQMRAFARSLARDETQGEDLTQDALASAWQWRGSFTPGTNLRAWVFTIVRNKFYSDRRRAWRVVQLDPKVAEETLVAVTSPNAALELDDVRRALLELTCEQRAALTLVAAVGLTCEEAAVICDCAAGTVKSRVSRARRVLSTILAEGRMTGERRAPGLAMGAIMAIAARARSQAAPRRNRQGAYA